MFNAKAVYSKIKLVFSNKKLFLFTIISFASIPFLIILSYLLCFRNKIYPQVLATNIDLSSKTKQEAAASLEEKIVIPEKLSLFFENQKYEISLADITFSYDYQKTANNAYNVYRSGSFFNNSANKLLALKNTVQLDLEIQYDQDKLKEYISVLADQLSVEPEFPSASVSNNQVVVNKGKLGNLLNESQLTTTILTNLKKADYSPILIPFDKVDPTLTDEQAETFKVRANKFLKASLLLNYDSQNVDLDDEKLISLLDFKLKFNDAAVNDTVEELKNEIDSEPQNAVFQFLPTQAGENGKVVEFIPAKDGLTVDAEELKNQLLNALGKIESSEEKDIEINVAITTEPPQITTESVNNLGIKELIGRGSSKFAGSISARIHNIGVASSKFNGVLVAPNEVFSFNRSLGDVSTFTGYKQAYIIKDGQTILGDGGGVCQVSTTMFRAALNAGLPIIERRAHSYRVGYYEQDAPVGLDATVYDPTTDFKFKNDTPAHILIQTQYNPKTASLVFEFYGTSDGRTSSTTKPIVTDITPPPEDLYIDDPTLPVGTIKQIDYKAWGAKAKFTYAVERGDEVIYQKTFYSNYQPWQAKFLTGKMPVN